MLGYTPRVNGNCPGRPISSATGRSRSVYSGATGSPLSVVNGASRSGVAPYACSQPSSGVWTCSVATAVRLSAVRVFVAGASGAIGAALVPMLVEAGHDVVAMTRTPGKDAGLRAAGAQPVVADRPDAAGRSDAVAAA